MEQEVTYPNFKLRKIPLWIRFCLIFIKPIPSFDGMFIFKRFRGKLYLVEERIK